MGENEPMENSEKIKFASPVSADIPFLSTQFFFKMADADIPETQTLGESVM